MSIDLKKSAYVKVNYTGFIAVLKIHGPIKAAWVDKEQIKELIRTGYDVTFLNPEACPEFAAQMAEYKKLCDAKDYVGAKALLSGKTIVGETITRAIRKAEATKPVVEKTTPNEVAKAIDKALNVAEGNVQVEHSNNEAPENDYSDQMKELDQSLGDGAGENEFFPDEKPFVEYPDHLAQEEEPVSDGAITVTKTSKKKSSKKSSKK